MSLLPSNIFQENEASKPQANKLIEGFVGCGVMKRPEGTYILTGPTGFHGKVPFQNSS